MKHASSANVSTNFLVCSFSFDYDDFLLVFRSHLLFFPGVVFNWKNTSHGKKTSECAYVVFDP